MTKNNPQLLGETKILILLNYMYRISNTWAVGIPCYMFSPFYYESAFHCYVKMPEINYLKGWKVRLGSGFPTLGPLLVGPITLCLWRDKASWHGACGRAKLLVACPQWPNFLPLVPFPNASITSQGGSHTGGQNFCWTHPALKTRTLVTLKIQTITFM